MSYCRFSKASNVYVFYNVNEYYECCGCWLSNTLSGFTTPSAQEMVDHLKKHEAIGHLVPDYAIEALQLEADNPNLRRGFYG